MRRKFRSLKALSEFFGASEQARIRPGDAASELQGIANLNREKGDRMQKPMILRNAVIALFFLAIASPAAQAQELPKPKGEVILSVTGKISHTNAAGRADFDREMLTNLGLAEIKTTHSWADKATVFEGVAAAKLLEVVGATGSRIKAAAINNYAIDLDAAELRKYPVLLALKADGVDLRRRDRGPIWIVYPRDTFPELKDEKHNFKWIWQLRSLDIQ